MASILKVDAITGQSDTTETNSPITFTGNTATLGSEVTIPAAGVSGTLGGSVTIPAAGVTGVLPVGVTGGSGLDVIPAAGISGVLPVGVTGGSGLDAISASSGQIIQVVAGTIVDGATTKNVSGGAGATWELKPTPYVEITPTSASNKIVVMGTIILDNASDMAYIDIHRSGTGVTDGRICGETGGMGYDYDNAERSVDLSSVLWTDSLSGIWTTGAIKYQYSFRASATSALVVIGAPAVGTMLMAMEIKG